MANQSKIIAVHVFTVLCSSEVACIVDYSSGLQRYYRYIPTTVIKFLSSSRAVLSSRSFLPSSAELSSHFYDVSVIGSCPVPHFEVYKPCNVPAPSEPAPAPAPESPANVSVSEPAPAPAPAPESPANVSVSEPAPAPACECLGGCPFALPYCCIVGFDCPYRPRDQSKRG